MGHICVITHGFTFRVGRAGQATAHGPSKCSGSTRVRAGNVENEESNRLSRILQNYNDSQLKELDAHVSSRREGKGSRRAKPARSATSSSFTKGMEQEKEKFERYFYRVEDGTWRPRMGVHGGDEPRWWALRVTIGREKQTCTAIQRRYQQLLEACSVEELDSMQEIDTWDVSKRVKAWSPKTEKMGNKMIRYDGGGWVMLWAKLDRQIASILRGNINVLGFHQREVFNGEEFPIPASDELIDTLTEWENDLSPISEEQVREEMGLPSPPTEQFFDDYLDDGRARKGRDKKSRGLFSDDSWGDEISSQADSWYGGTESFDDQKTLSSTKEGFIDDDIVPDNAFGAWFEDFDKAATDDWSTLDEGKSVYDKQVAPQDDDLSWWDDTSASDENDDSRDSIVSHALGNDGFSPSNSDEDSQENSCSESTVAIEVISGAFKDFEGIILEDKDDSSKVTVKIDVFGKPTVVDVLRDDIRPL